MSEERSSNLKRFSGDDDDAGKALKKWKAWALARMITVKDLSKEQRGPWLFTLLDGRALEACEHLTLEDLNKDGGDKTIWTLLEDRFPEKEVHDQMGEALGEVFALAAQDGEAMKEWTARVRETFEKCQRKAKVDFPVEARGWIALHCAGLSEEQKAIVKAKTQGKLDLETVSAGIRSCFPTYRAGGSKSRRATSVFIAEENDNAPEDDETNDFPDVEAFLADFGQTVNEEDPLSEGDVAEALAVSWKERRAEIGKLQKSRKFGAADQARRSFRIEVEELKRRTRCRRCGKLGHWQKECRSKLPPSSKGSGKSSGKGAGSDSSSLLDNRAAETLLAQPENVEEEIYFVGAAEEALAASLISSPGYGVVDSGCGKTLIGEETLRDMETLLGGRQVTKTFQRNSFRFGNGEAEDSTTSACIPVAINGKIGRINAAIIRGKAPLLLGRPTLEKLCMTVDFAKGEAQILDQDSRVPLERNSAGQLLLRLVDFPVSQARTGAAPAIAESFAVQQDSKESPKSEFPNIPQKVGIGPPTIQANKRITRQILNQWKKQDRVQHQRDSQIIVAELFSPPRFKTEAERLGFKGLSFDLLQGWDLTNADTQKEVDRLLERAAPDLLVVCPPCKHWGGWFHLNSSRMTPLERAKLVQQARAQARFAA